METLERLLHDAAFLIIGGAVLGFILLAYLIAGYLLRLGKRSHTDVARATRFVEDIEGELRLDQLDLVERNLPKAPLFRQQWHEFRESIVELPDGRAENSIPLGEFIRDDAYLASIGGGWFKFPVLHYLPGVATSLGVLGTFLGITVGLWNLDANTETVEIQPFIGGLSTAFLTSIFGVAASLVINVRAGHREAQLLEGLHRFLEAVERKIPRVTSEKLLAESLRYSASQGAALEAIQRTVEESQSSLDAMRVDAEESRANLQTIANDLVDSLASRFDDSLGQILAPQLAAITEAVQNQVATAAESGSNEARRFADEMVGQLAGSLDKSFSDMGAKVTAATGQFESVSESLQEVVQAARASAVEQRSMLEESGQAVQRALEQSRAAASDLQAVQSVGAQLGHLSEVLSEQHSRAQSLHSDQAELQRNAQEQVASIHSSIGTAAAAYSETAAGLQAVLPALREAVEMMHSSAASLSEAAARASGAVVDSSSSLVARSQVETSLLEGFRDTAQQFGTAFSRASPALTGFERAASELSAQHESSRELLTGLTKLTDGLAGTNASLREGVAATETGLARAARDIEGAVASTGRWSEVTVATVERFGEQVRQTLEGSLREYDKSLGHAVQQLSASMKSLEDLAEEIAHAVAQRGRARNG